MKNINKFIIQAILALLVMSVGLGMVFCLLVGSIDYFVPFMQVSLIAILAYCFSLTMLNKM